MAARSFFFFVGTRSFVGTRREDMLFDLMIIISVNVISFVHFSSLDLPQKGNTPGVRPCAMLGR